MSAELTQPASDAAEPKTGTGSVPVWLLVLALLMLYWAMVHFVEHGAWFNEQVYTPYRSFDQLAAIQPVSGEADFIQKGKKLYGLNCAVCHMEGGTGNPGNGCPNLMGSEWVTAAGPGRIIRIVS